MKTAILIAALGIATVAQAQKNLTPRDSIILSDPCVLADKASATYYMTGTGGQLWKSADLQMWDGPYDVAFPDSTSWTGPKPEIWAAELHQHNGKYYYFATFTNNSIITGHNDIVGDVPRRASHILVSDRPDGPYIPVGKADYLPSSRPTLDGTFWTEADGTPYMVFCGEWIENNNGTIEKIRLKPDLSASEGEPQLLFRASDSPWSREKMPTGIQFNRVTDGPWLFRTDTGRLGMIWTSWIFQNYTTGVAYSESGTLDGPWIQEPRPILPPDFGHGMIFRDFQGRTLLSAHSHADIDGRYVRRPTLWEIDLSGDKLKVVRQIP